MSETTETAPSYDHWCLAGMSPDRLLLGRCTHFTDGTGQWWPVPEKQAFYEEQATRLRLTDIVVLTTLAVPVPTQSPRSLLSPNPQPSIQVLRINNVSPLGACGYGATIDITPSVLAWLTTMHPEDAANHMKLHQNFQSQSAAERHARERAGG